MSDSETDKTHLFRSLSGQPGSETGPIVLEYKKPKKKKARQAAAGTAKFSPELKDLQVVGTDVVRATHKAASALVKGIDTYERERLRSMNEKKDGALEDFVYNAGKAASVWLKEASDIPLDLAESLRRSEGQKRARKRLRRVSKALRQWQM
jgi:hypothetical protein